MTWAIDKRFRVISNYNACYLKRSGYLAGHYRFGLHLNGPIRISSRLHWVYRLDSD